MPIILYFFILLGFHAAGENRRPDWVEYARQLIGEKSSVRESALKKLGEIFTNFEKLEGELNGPYRHYALDVAVAMRFPGVVESLLTQLDTDIDGSLTLAVNALLSRESHGIIGENYLRYLRDRDLNLAPTSVVLAIVDFFTHTRKRLPNDLFAKILSHPRVEIQQSGALYAAVAGDENHNKLVVERMAQFYPQVRTQILLTYYDDKKIKQAEMICKGDKDAIVQNACQSLKFPARQKKIKKVKKSLRPHNRKAKK